MKNLVLSLVIFAMPLAPTTQAAQSAQTVQTALRSQDSVPFNASIDFTYLNQSIDPITGRLVTTGFASATGTFGVTAGTFRIELDLATYTFTGMRSAMAPDGSSYVVDFSGYFLDAINSTSTFDVRDGTGRFEGLQVSGSVSSTEWTNGVAGNSSYATGVATR
jgi:hypothetical protein